MKTGKYNNVRICLRVLVLAGMVFLTTGLAAQQHIINQKDNTRPETSRQYNDFNLSSFNAIQQNGYNEIQWQVPENARTNRYLVEYSFDGIEFLPGEEVLSHNGLYNYRHYIQDTRPLLYRIRSEDISGTLSYSGAILPKGLSLSPVQVHQNVVKGNVINLTTQFPLERMIITSNTGLQLFAKDINGQRDFIPVAIPSLDRGVYFVTFFGNGWKTTSRIVVDS